MTFQPHENGIFDVKWSFSDELLATASGDQSIRVTTVASSARSATRTLHILRGHEGTVKSVAWDPNHDGVVLCSGGREGSICLWDLRVGEGRRDDEASGSLAPVLTIAIAHDRDGKSPKPKGRGRKLVAAAPLKSITQVLYTDSHPYGVVSSCSSDGYVAFFAANHTLADTVIASSTCGTYAFRPTVHQRSLLESRGRDVLLPSSHPRPTPRHTTVRAVPAASPRSRQAVVLPQAFSTHWGRTRAYIPTRPHGLTRCPASLRRDS